MTIAKRLLLLIGFGIVSLLLLSWINFQQMERVYGKANYGNENTVPSILTLDRALLEFGRIRVRTYRHALTHDEAMMSDLEKRIKEGRDGVERALNDYEKLVSDEEDRRQLEQSRAALADYVKGVEHVLSESRANRKEEARVLLVQYAQKANRLNDQLVAQMKYNEDLGRKVANDASGAKRQAVWIAAGVFLVTLVGLSAFGWVTMRSLTSRVAEANRVAERIALGDLSSGGARLGGSHDEIGMLLMSLEKMRADLGKTIGDIVSGAEAVAASSAHLSTAAQQVAISSDHQSQSTSSAAAAVEELTVSIDHVGGSADDANARAKEAEAKAIDSGKDVDHASTQIAEVANRVEHSAEQIQALSTQVQQINNVTVVIREVADQTNLLALNAAIEAARAGEQGRGFAVVADEVRKLAERTTSSVQEIAAMISTIQEGAVSAVSSMQSSRQVVNEVVATAGRASASMGDIRVSAETVQKSVSGISDALREQRSASVDLSRNVETIAQMSEENSAAVAAVAKTANDLVSVSDRLKGSVARFRL